MSVILLLPEKQFKKSFSLALITMHITAPRIHNGRKWLPEGTTISLNEQGKILSLLPTPPEGTIFYDGVLAPGFVNVHCHLELSHMQGVIPEHTGLIPFLKDVSFRRNEHTEAQKTEARFNAFNQMFSNGIVAVGDIANTTDTLDLRALGHLHFHSFIEALGFTEVNAARSFGFAVKTYEAFATQEPGNKINNQSITPHAPYSVSGKLFQAIDAYQPGSVLSIHNQESEAEDQYYREKTGGVQDLLQAMGIDDSYFVPTGKSSIRSYMAGLGHGRPYIFVHNTYTSREDVQYIKAGVREAYWCLCPNANLYIENRLPDVDMLVSEGATLCIGTDSLASNHQLCILSELYSLKQHYPALEWEQLLKWATHNGAIALQMQDVAGVLEPGMSPGIVQLLNIDTAERPIVKRVF